MQESVPQPNAGKMSQVSIKSVITTILIFVVFITVLLALGISRKKNKCFDKVSVYFVYAQKFKIKTDETQKDMVKSLGGAGVFYWHKEYHYLIVSAYTLKDDANEIADSIKDRFEDSGVLTVEADAISFDVQQLIKEDMNCFMFFQKLREFSCDVEKNVASFCMGELTQGDLMNVILKQKLEFESLAHDFAGNLSNKLQGVIKTSAQKMSVLFENLFNEFYQSSKKQSLLQQFIVEFSLLRVELFNNLQ